MNGSGAVVDGAGIRVSGKSGSGAGFSSRQSVNLGQLSKQGIRNSG